ncbi:MAG: hypothetical protein Q4G55_00800 [bacterium]|nr:hypothetical protein [bacterium]
MASDLDMFKRIVLTFASFWLAGVVALVVMSDPGAMSNPDSIVMLPFMAVVGMFVGPMTFVAGVHGLMFGYGSGVPTPWALWVALSYVGYLGLFAGAVVFKQPKLRVACLVIEALCALVAAKGVAYCI